MRYLITFFLITIYSFGFNYYLKPYNITDNISCMFGLNGEPNKINGGRVINTCYINTPKGYVVIDSGPTYSYAKQAYSAMKKRKSLPVKYVINTSAQEINILGNEFYKNIGAKIISPTSYKSILKDKKLKMATQISANAFRKTRLVPSNGYINRYKKLSIGGVDIIIRNLEKGSSKNLIVYVPKFKTLFAGNYIYNQSELSLGEHKSFLSWSKAIKKIESMKWNYIIPSHGTKIHKSILNSTKTYIENHLKLISEKDKNKIVEKEVLNQINQVKYIQYIYDFSKAKKEAIKENKLLMIKIESNHCQPCEKLNEILETNNRIKQLINNNMKVLKINIDYEHNVPLGLNYMGTPTLFLIEPKTEKILMKLQGVIEANDLEESIKINLY